MANFRNFATFWDGLSASSQQKMSKLDVEFGWMARSADIQKAKLQGRREALKSLIHELDSHDYFRERDMVQSFYKSDVSYREE